MGRIAVIGTGPLQELGVRFFSGQCLRTWHFTKPLLDAGHDILLITHPIDDRAFQPDKDPVVRSLEFQGLRYWALQSNQDGAALAVIEEKLADFHPDAILGINPFPASLACRQRFRAPVWADMNGYVPAEGQTHCRLHDSDAPLEHFWRMEKEVIRRADRISTVSRAQRLATLGELAVLGRLNRHTHDYHFVSYIPNAVSERFARMSAPPRRFRGTLFPEGAFVLLWAGGFNTWTDVATLHAMLERVMARQPGFHFVATGGAIAGHDEKSFLSFKKAAKASPHADRYHLLGWVETEAVDALFFEADLGVNIDSFNYETVFGARNRLTSMMACGLPVLTTLGTEISEDIRAAEAGWTAPIGDADALAGGIFDAMADREGLRSLGRRGREWALREFSYERTTREVVAWAAAPAYAPDNAERLRRDDPSLPLDRIALHSLDELLSACDRERYEALCRDQRDLAAIRQKPLWRMAKAIKRLLGAK